MNSNKELSLISLQDSNPAKLRQQIRRFDFDTSFPKEFILCLMASESRDFVAANFPIRHLRFKDSDQNLPFARASNHAATEARGGILVFLNSDCLPEPGFLKNYMESYDSDSAIFQGEVRTLRDQQVDFRQKSSALLDSHSEPEVAVDHFRGFNFAISPKLFRSIGGFEEKFLTRKLAILDFEKRLINSNIPIKPVKAKVWRLPGYQPENNLYRVDALVKDSRFFFEKWRQWPLETELHNLKKLGAIQFDPSTGTLRSLI